jgi:hypothetical protein
MPAKRVQRPTGSSLIRNELGEKQCLRCAAWKPTTDFYSNPTTVDRLASYCKLCHNLFSRCRRKGISPEQYSAMVTAQSGVCGVCGVTPPDSAFVIDHDHSCCSGSTACGQCVRGLLCAPCNFGLGSFLDNPNRLDAAAAYLRGWR